MFYLFYEYKENIMEMKFYRCRICGKIVAMVNETPVPTICCGEAMQLLVPGTTDAAQEKHVPVVTKEGNKVTVKIGSVEHPMAEEHYIQWIALQTKNGNQRKILKPGDKPEAVFALMDDDEIVAVYEYCNLHSLWAAK